jgi:hypothetical protein
VKTDARDALHLARLLRLDEVVPVRVPSLAEEAARDLVRAREAARADLMRSRHRVSNLLLRHGIVYSGGKAWTELHDRWLRQQRFGSMPTEPSQPVLCTQPLYVVGRSSFQTAAGRTGWSVRRPDAREVRDHPTHEWRVLKRRIRS